jgi:hypothetical protein
MTRPISELEQWANLNDAIFHNVKPASAGDNRGSGLIATKDLNGDEENEPLLVIPRDLVLSKETVELLSKSDKDLRTLLEALGDFVQTPRGALLTFLLYCHTMNRARSANHHLGALTPFNQYVQFLPPELLPTFWSEDEIALLVGTSLHAAVLAKQKSLSRDLDRLREATQEIRWCQDLWWNVPSTSLLSDLILEDWMQVDAQYRSRALEFPGIGDSMVPCLDVANHASGSLTSALYETDGDGNAVLLLRPGTTVKEGEEITITYGDSKGACEMLFSYGFIEEGMEDARELFLPLNMSSEDPLGAAKNHVSTFAPGVKIYRDKDGGEVKWFSEYVYLMILNQEDGLDFAVTQTIEGERGLQMLWHELPVSSDALGVFVEKTLREDEFWEVWQLRATVTVLQKVREQVDVLAAVDVKNVEKGGETDVRERCFDLAVRLRELEGGLMMEAIEELKKESARLMESEVVGRWFALQQQADGVQPTGEEDETEDFT